MEEERQLSALSSRRIRMEKKLEERLRVPLHEPSVFEVGAGTRMWWGD